MPIELLIPLLTQVGIPLTTQLIALWEKKTTVTSEQWLALLKTVQDNTPTTQMLNALRALGVDPDSEKGKNFLAMVNV